MGVKGREGRCGCEGEGEGEVCKPKKLSRTHHKEGGGATDTLTHPLLAQQNRRSSQDH